MQLPQIISGLLRAALAEQAAWRRILLVWRVVPGLASLQSNIKKWGPTQGVGLHWSVELVIMELIVVSQAHTTIIISTIISRHCSRLTQTLIPHIEWETKNYGHKHHMKCMDDCLQIFLFLWQSTENSPRLKSILDFNFFYLSKPILKK